MSGELKHLKDQYVTALDSSERIRVKYNGKLEDMSAEEAAQWGKWLDEADGLKSKIDLLEREQKARAWADTPRAAVKLAGAGAGSPDPEELKAFKDGEKKAWKSYFKGVPTASMTPDALKALAAQEGDLGGFLVMPQELVNQLVVLAKDLLFVRKMATVYGMDKAESLGIPVLDTDLGDPTWTAELGTGSEDSTAPYGKRQLSPHPLARRIKISNKLLRQASIDPEAIVMDRLAYKVARVEENGFLNGTGADQPLGVFVASAAGISTGRDTTAAGSSALVGDDFISTKHALKANYWGKAQWILHRLILAAVRKLKDSQGQYLWQPGLGGYVAQGTALVGANPETLLGLPINMSELAPSAITTGLYVAVLGDFTYYWIADALNMQIQRLVELYAETNQTGFILRKETDAMPVLEEAFVRLRMA